MSIDKISMISRIFDIHNFPVLFDTKVLDTVETLEGDKVTHYNSLKASQYFHNFIVKTLDGNSFYVGTHHNSKNPKIDGVDVKLEYNPNKISRNNNALLDMIIGKYFHRHARFKITAFDYCRDIPIPMSSIIPHRKRKRRYMLYSETQATDDITHYLGKGDGRVKIYNKAREQGLTISLTRFEISFKQDLQRENISNLNVSEEPIAIILDYRQSDMWQVLNIENELILRGIQENPAMYNHLSRRKQQKIQNLIDSMEIFRFKKREIVDSLDKYLYNYHS